MRFRLLNTGLILVVAAMAFVVGCKRAAKEQVNAEAAEEGAPAPKPLQGGDLVTAALERKDYAGAIGALASMKAQAAPGQMAEYREMRSQVLDVLVQDMAANPAAAEAYKVLRLVETGR